MKERSNKAVSALPRAGRSCYLRTNKTDMANKGENSGKSAKGGGSAISFMGIVFLILGIGLFSTVEIC